MDVGNGESACVRAKLSPPSSLWVSAAPGNFALIPETAIVQAPGCNSKKQTPNLALGAFSDGSEQEFSGLGCILKGGGGLLKRQESGPTSGC